LATCWLIVLAPRTLRPRALLRARFLDRLEVEAVVHGEVLVLRRDQRQRQARRHAVEVAPVVSDAGLEVPVRHRRQLPGHHERRERRIDEAQRHHLQHRQQHAGEHQQRQAPQPAAGAAVTSAWFAYGLH
jgi:hypothetical protein